MKEAKKQWVTMRSLSLEIAKKVTVARSLGAYNQAQWSSSFLNPESLAFHGYMDQIARDAKMRELTTPTNANSAEDIIDAAGTDLRMYGDDLLSSEWRDNRDKEYKKWVERNGFGIDDRHIHAQRVKHLIYAAYKE